MSYSHLVWIRPPGTQGAKVTTVPFLAGGTQVSLPALSGLAAHRILWELVCGRTGFHQRKHVPPGAHHEGSPAVPYQGGHLRQCSHTSLGTYRAGEKSMSPEGAVGLPLCPCVPPHIWPTDWAVLGHWEEFCAKVSHQHF